MAALRQLRNQNRKLYPQIIPVYQIWTKIGMSMLVTPKNEPIEELLIFLKIQDGGLWSKVQNRPNLTSQITFQLSISIPFIRFGQNFAWTYKLTLETKLRKKFTFFWNSRWPPAAKNWISTKFRLKNHISAWQTDPVHPIWTKFGRHILFDPRNKPTE